MGVYSAPRFLWASSARIYKLSISKKVNTDIPTVISRSIWGVAEHFLAKLLPVYQCLYVLERAFIRDNWDIRGGIWNCMFSCFQGKSIYVLPSCILYRLSLLLFPSWPHALYEAGGKNGKLYTIDV